MGAVVYLGLEFPAAGTTVGGHFQGAQYGTRQFSYQLTEAARARWTREAQQEGEARLRSAGFQVRSVGMATSDAEALRGVQYGLSGRVAELAVRSSGPAEPYSVDAQAEIAWEVLDIGSGHLVFGRAHRGSARLTGAVDEAVALALDRSLERLVTDTTFLLALALPRATPDAGAAGRFTRATPRANEVILLTPADLNPVSDAPVVGRVAGGVVGLHGPGGAFYGPAVVLTRDGYALTTARAGRTMRDRPNVRVRFENGVERPVRTLRVNRTLGVALVQIACPGDCQTVAWEAPAAVPVFMGVLAVGASGGTDGAIAVAPATVGGRWGTAHGLTLQGNVFGGEALADAATGTVFAVVANVGTTRVAVLLSEALRALRVRPPPPAAP